MDNKHGTCSNCRYWQDFSDRVFAHVHGVRTSFSGNRIELRRCGFRPPPGVEATSSVYTDEKYTCSAYTSTLL